MIRFEILEGDEVLYKGRGGVDDIELAFKKCARAKNYNFVTACAQGFTALIHMGGGLHYSIDLERWDDVRPTLRILASKFEKLAGFLVLPF